MQLNTNLTSAQIDALPAGSDLDLLVGQHLFRLGPYREGVSGQPGYQGKGSQAGWHFLPRYSIDHAAMLEVLRLLLYKRIEVDISSGGHLVSLRFRDRGRGGVDGVSAHWSGAYYAFPLAVSQAALKLPYL